MALIKCPGCGKNISDKAPKCPHCGHERTPKPQLPQSPEPQEGPEENLIEGGNSSKRTAIIVAVLVLLIAGGIAYWMLSKDTAGAEEDATEQLRADSIAHARELQEAAMADSLRLVAQQDSIKKAEARIAENRLNITHFCKWNSSEGVMAQRKVSEIASKLQALGFTVISSDSHLEESEVIGPITVESKTLQREADGYFVKVTLRSTESLQTEITFSDSKEMDAFLATLVPNKFKKLSASSYTGVKNDCYWTGTDVYVNGNTVTLDERFEP